MTTGPSARRQLIPIACTLDATAMPDRLDEWRAVLGQATARTAGADGSMRVEFADGVDVGHLATLAAAEQQCCEFFSFALTLDERGIALEVGAPAEAADIVAVLFGSRP